MGFLKKSLFIVAILVAYVAVSTVALDAATKSSGNFCDKSKKTPFDGTQNKDGSCVDTFMGELPSRDKMVSTVILFPKDGSTIPANKNFTILVKISNLVTGFFDDPATQYYLFPQTLDDNGLIQGHSHVTVQKINGDRQILDPTIFAFFKGLNGKAENGVLSAVVEKGLPAGKYRLCTMCSSFGHQPTYMPVAQRGAQDDCIRFKVSNRRRRSM